MTAADLLTKMTVLNNSLRVASAEEDEGRALAALDMAQSHYEALASTYPRIKSAATTIAITDDTEATAWPTDLLRLDSLWMIDTTVTPNRPSYEITPIRKSGGHSESLDWPAVLLALPQVPAGKTRRYWTDRANLYWYPFPDDSYTARLYGFSGQTNLTSRSITFGHPDIVAEPIAAFAVRLLSIGVQDPSDETNALAREFFGPVLKSLSSGFVRSGPRGKRFSRGHDT